MSNYRNYFGFTLEPFSKSIAVDKLCQLPGMMSAYERFLFTVELGAVGVITGDVGSGKSTALRYACSQLHPSSHKIIPVVANTGTILEILRGIAEACNIDRYSNSGTLITKAIQKVIIEIAAKKQKPVLVIDEAHLMRVEVFAQLHTLNQFDFDSRPIMPIILCGQNSLVDKLIFHACRPLASRVIGKTHLDCLKSDDMKRYIHHHLNIAGVSEQLFSEEAVLAVHQGSGGFLRRANMLAIGSLVKASSEKMRVVSAEHVRIAASELL